MSARVSILSDVHPGYRTEVAVGVLTVTGVLPGTAWRPEGSIVIAGENWSLSAGEARLRLRRDQARELAAALVVVADCLDACADERYGATVRREG